MRTITYEFEELPLVIENRVQAALINGSAEIKYGRDCQDWHIVSIAVEGYRNLTLAEYQAGMPSRKYIPPSDELEKIIRHRLEHEWASHIDSAVAVQLEEDRESAAETRREMQRERWL